MGPSALAAACLHIQVKLRPGSWALSRQTQDSGLQLLHKLRAVSSQDRSPAVTERLCRSTKSKHTVSPPPPHPPPSPTPGSCPFKAACLFASFSEFKHSFPLVMLQVVAWTAWIALESPWLTTMMK